jgi:hypothetical protein
MPPRGLEAMENETPASDKVEKGGVRFSDQEIAEVDASHPGGRPVLRIPRDRIREIHLRWGAQAARPLVQLILGGGFLGAACYIQVSMLWEWFRYGGVIHAEVVAGLVVLGFVGGWLLFTALRRGFYLAVQTSGAQEKVRFDRRLPRQEIETLLNEARRRFGYEISQIHLVGPESR